MDVEIFVHGVPNGEAFWGKEEEERNYFGTFYDHSSDTEKILIQTRNVGNKRYCYYNYLIYRTSDSPSPNVVAFDGRDGSYIGLSLRLDFYYKDFAQIYRIMGMLYNKHILGAIVKKDRAKLRYLVPEFKNCSAILEKMREEALNLIGKYFKQENCTSLNSFIPIDKAYNKRNLYDCTDEIVFNDILQNSRIAISPYYDNAKTSNILADCNKKISDCNQQFDARLRAESEANRKKIEQVNSQIAQLQKELNTKVRDIEKLRGENSKLKEEIGRNKQFQEISQLLSTINGPLNNLTSVLYKIVPSEKWGGKDVKVKKWYKRPIYYVYTVNLIVLALLVMKPFGNINIEGLLGSDGQSTAVMNGTIDSLKASNGNLIKENVSLKQDIDNLKAELSPTNLTGLKFDIPEYSGSGDLTIGKEYRAVLVPEKGEFDVSGANFKKEGKNSIVFTPTESTVTLSFNTNAGKEERTLNAK